MMKRYLEDQAGVPLTDVWTDIKPLHNLSAERTRYPTQKPSELLKRIILSSSNRGDLVLDPFCGCGTTIEAAEELGRRWIGIDVAYHAIKVIEDRLDQRFRGLAKFQTLGIPSSYDDAVALADRDKYQFQWWANYLFDPHALKEVKRGSDRGIDGVLFFPRGPGRPGHDKLLMSVKGGRRLSPAMVRDFRGVLDREQAAMGIFVCLDHPTFEMEREAASAGFVETAQGRKRKLQIFSIRGWFDGDKPDLPHAPHLEVAAVNKRRHPKTRTAIPNAPELPLFIKGGKGEDQSDKLLTFNPGRIRSAS
jgi:site-specific DNA-methyltransferase (adenine-specific)